jgi:hypothetical protein
MAAVSPASIKQPVNVKYSKPATATATDKRPQDMFDAMNQQDRRDFIDEVDSVRL